MVDFMGYLRESLGSYSRSEIARRMGTTKQNVDRILDKDDMKVSQYIEFCKEFDSIALYRIITDELKWDNLHLTDQGNLDILISDVTNVYGSKAELLLGIQKLEFLEKRVLELESTVKDKEEIIRLLKKS
ncbi:hypothetical protein [Crocinitomix catalasitica]|uniref:hypothetical protein n=1 Tax=Crocinitomix catalasitica TaxID=184607 RepID=UPI00048548A4|nr:hypothetical protein [Crocinitomix catalasitica]